MQVSAAQRQQAAVFFHPHSFIKFGVRAQFTDEAKINLIRSGLIPPQMRFSRRSQMDSLILPIEAKCLVVLALLNEQLSFVQKMTGPLR